MHLHPSGAVSPSRPSFYQEALAVEPDVASVHASVAEGARGSNPIVRASLSLSERMEQHSKHNAGSRVRLEELATPSENTAALAQHLDPLRLSTTEESSLGPSRHAEVRNAEPQVRDKLDMHSESDLVNTPGATVGSFEANAAPRERPKEDEHKEVKEATERFADLIGWNDEVSTSTHVSRPASARWSGISVLSRVEAYVVDTTTPQRASTLRKVVKNDSLRSVSSPVPCRDSLHSASPSSHRLVHKNVRLSGANRLSGESQVSRSLSLGSSPVVARSEPGPATVLTEARASLYSPLADQATYTNVISNKSEALDTASTMFISPREPYNSRVMLSRDVRLEMGERDRNFPPFHRLSPSSASSVVTEHDHSAHRQQAENDLRATLDRMESERMSIGLHQLSRGFNYTVAPKVNITTATPIEPLSRIASSRRSRSVTSGPDKNFDMNTIIPGTKEWYELRPDNPETPHTQRSGLSASPEINEATAVNFFPHNNGSVQLIEPFKLSEATALRLREHEPRMQPHTIVASSPSKSLHVLTNDRQSTTSSVTVGRITPKIDDLNLPGLHTHAVTIPYHNPREAPKPPVARHVLPPFSTATVQDSRHGSPARLSPTPADDTLHGNAGDASNFGMRNANSLRPPEEFDSNLRSLSHSQAFRIDGHGEDCQTDMHVANVGQGLEYHGSNTHSRYGFPFELFPRRARSEAEEPTWLARRLSRRKPRQPGQPLEQDSMGSSKHEQINEPESRLAFSRQMASKQHTNQECASEEYMRPLDNVGLLKNMTTNRAAARLGSLRTTLLSIHSRKEKREEIEREQRRLRLKNSIGNDIISQSDSRFPIESHNEPLVAGRVGVHEHNTAIHNEKPVEQTMPLSMDESQRPESDDSWTTAREIATSTNNASANSKITTTAATQRRKRQPGRRKDRPLTGPDLHADNPYMTSTLDPRVDGDARQVTPPTVRYKDITQEYKASVGQTSFTNHPLQPVSLIDRSVGAEPTAPSIPPRAFSFEYQPRPQKDENGSATARYNQPTSERSSGEARSVSRFTSFRRIAKLTRSASDRGARSRPASWASTVSSTASPLNRVPYVGSLSRSSSMARYAAEHATFESPAEPGSKHTKLWVPKLTKGSRDVDAIAEREKDPQRTIWPAFMVGEVSSEDLHAKDALTEHGRSGVHQGRNRSPYIGSLNRIDSIARYRAHHGRMPPSSYTYRENATPRRSRSDRV